VQAGCTPGMKLLDLGGDGLGNVVARNEKRRRRKADKAEGREKVENVRIKT